MDRLELIALHVETLFVLDEAGDTLTSNEPYPPGRRRRGRTRVWLPRALSACSLPDETPRVTTLAHKEIGGRGGRIRTVDLLVPKLKCHRSRLRSSPT